MAMEWMTMTNDKNVQNFFRLVKMIMVEGTKAAQSCVAENLPPNTMLQEALNNNHEKIRQLKVKGCINTTQYKSLYPNRGCRINPSQFDINTWVILARNICASNIPEKDWNIARMEDLDSDKDSWEHDLLRVRLIRNHLFHMTAPEMDDIQFTWLWREARSALERLSSTFRPDTYAQLDVVNGDEMVNYVLELKRQCMEDQIDTLNGELRHRRRLILVWTGLIIFLVVALILAIPVTWYLSHPDTCSSHQKSYRVGKLGQINVISRSAWGALDPKQSLSPLSVPVKYAVVGHTAWSDVCSTVDGCCTEVKSMQMVQINLDNYHDISYHYMIDSSGVVYEGRDAHHKTHTNTSWDDAILFISLLGNFMRNAPSETALQTLENLLEWLRIGQGQDRLLVDDYILYPYCQIKDTLSPGKNLFDKLNNTSEFPHFMVNKTTSYCNFTIIH